MIKLLHEASLRGKLPPEFRQEFRMVFGKYFYPRPITFPKLTMPKSPKNFSLLKVFSKRLLVMS